MLTIRLPEETEKRLDELVKRTGHTKSSYVREAILEHLDDIEDIYLAEQRLTEIHSGRVTTIPLSKVMKDLGMID